MWREVFISNNTRYDDLYIDEFHFDICRFAKNWGPNFTRIVCFDFGGGSSKSTSTSYTPAMEKWQEKALNIYGPTLGQGEYIYPGERLAPMTPVQTQATDVQGFLERFAPYRDMPMFGETGKALGGMLAGTTGAAPISPEATERYISEAISKPRRTAFEKIEAPAIREEYAGPGYWGSARPRAVSRERAEMEDWIGEMGAQTRWDVEQANRAIEEAKAGRALSAIQPAMLYTQLPTQEARARLAGRGDVLGLSTVQQQQRQAEINTALMKFAEENRLTSAEDMEILLALLGMRYAKEVSETEGPGLGYVMAGSALGEFGTKMGGAAASTFLASDIRVKENIKPLKNALEKVRKLKAYVYNYIGEKNTTMGVMAQDVEKILPEAVVEINGIKHINKFAIQSLIISALNELLGDKKCQMEL